MAEVLVTW
ncbi:Protein of unknown function [Propionibacterium freudenreichii]|uniref:Uncharacterized protein n=1 Tax=Propionibacterium freudenreichii subsp. freudenreichii TaxID=66712 RepID=A0A068VSZ4_PROFF|nr:Protein of unknown function [Propionibacterium freudenreichii subsp. freudenreichii]CEG86165.1 Protein of unknown function [Propionibacterium freudenreichii]CEG87946.1 Protein of unknown function [Propionibacterium freudenreichii]CEG91472.1 Protein of unknown function [Propionibacterium freudenreichii]CEG92867.1 Protein of unknown function [Propionibacterium freudenreichii]